MGQLLSLRDCHEVALQIDPSRKVARLRSFLPFQVVAIVSTVAAATLLRTDVSWIHPEWGSTILLAGLGVIGIVFIITFPKWQRRIAHREVETALAELKCVAYESENAANARIHVTGAPVELCAVLAATHLEHPTRAKEWPIWGPVFEAGPMGSLFVVWMLLTVGYGVGMCAGFTIGLALVAGTVAWWLVREYLRPTHLIVDNRRLKIVSTSWLGAEQEAASVWLPSVPVRINFTSGELAIGTTSMIQRELRSFMRPHQIAGAILANSLPEHVVLQLEDIGEWGRVCQHRR